MDDAGLVGNTSVHEKESGANTSALLHTYSEKFNDVFPYYLSIGMTYEQFWNMDCTLVRHYNKAAQIRREMKNQELWLQGMYVYEALCDVAPIFHAFAKKGTKPVPFRSEPYELGVGVKEVAEKPAKKSKEEKEFDRLKTAMEVFMVNHNRKFEKEGSGVNE